MARLSHNFEAGVAEATVVAGAGSNSDTAGNNFFDSVNIDVTGTPGVVSFTSYPVKSGKLALKIHMGSVAAITSVTWSASRGDLVDDYVRGYCYISNYLTINSPMIKWFSSALASMARVTWNNVGKIELRDHADNIIATSVTVLPTMAWARVEVHFQASTTSALLEARIFAGANVDATVPTETMAARWVGNAASSARVDFGLVEGVANQPPNGFLVFDEIVAGDSNWIGPSLRPTSAFE